MSLGMRKTATSLTRQFGTTFTLRTITRTKNVATGKVTETASNIPGLKAAIAGYETRLVDGTLILASDLQMVVSAGVFPGAPVPAQQRIILPAGVFQMLGVKPLYDGDEIAGYEIQLRTA